MDSATRNVNAIHTQTLNQRENVVINIFRAMFALGSFALKVAVDQDKKEPLQLQTRIIGAAFFCTISIIPLWHSKLESGRRGHGGPPLSTDIQTTAGRQLISSRKSRMLALYLILWWYACRAVPSIQSRVAASPVVNDAYNQLLEKLSEMFCNNDGDERLREIDAVVEQRIEEERLHFQSVQSQLVAEERSARLSAESKLHSLQKDMNNISSELDKEKHRTCACNDNDDERDIFDAQIDEMKRNMDAIRLEYEEKTNATKSVEEKLRNEIASLVEARDEIQRQALVAKQKHNEELARARDEEIKTKELLKQRKAEQAILEETVHDAKVLIETLKEENIDIHLEAEDIARKLETTQDELAAEVQRRIQEEERRTQAEEREALADNDAREKSRMLDDAIVEKEACIAARARRGLFRRRGGKKSTPSPERKTVNVQSALVEIWTTSDWLFALF